jgi:hypothetical protein
VYFRITLEITKKIKIKINVDDLNYKFAKKKKRESKNNNDLYEN